MRFFAFASLVLLIQALLSSVATTNRPSEPANTPLTEVRPSALSNKTYMPLSTYLFDPTYINPFGIDMYWHVDAANGLNHMRDAGAKRVTTVLDWAAIEPAEGVRDWSSFDVKVRNATDAGMEVFVLFIGDPTWAWNPQQTGTIPEKRLNFVRAMVQRYDCDGSNDAPNGLCVRQWSFYAEPDFYVDYLQQEPGYKGFWGKRGAEYGHMIADVANVIHSEDPGARVMIGGVAYDSFLPPDGTRGFVREFLPTVLATLNAKPGGARAYLDAIAVHYYSLSFPTIGDKLREIRGIMHAHNVAQLPLLVPETGYWSQGDSTETKQAQRLVQIFVEGLSYGVEHLSYYTVFDSGDGSETSGLFRGQNLNSPKPAYVAYRTLTRELAGARYRQPLGQAGIVGHVFQTPRRTDKTVAWTPASSATATLFVSCARVVDKLGAEIRVNDGGAGDADSVTNGRVGVRLTSNEPVYVEACP